ncbi:MAG: DUF962 domain-containing protein [Sandaracinaceae bacterium]
MIDELMQRMSDPKQRSLALLAGGTIGLMSGAKATPLAMFAVGLRGLEDQWRAQHPEFVGGIAERWSEALSFYDATHQDATNRVLHTVGIPMIAGGFVGMLAAPRYTPPWWIANGSWTLGWVLNFVGHGFFEKGAPAFADDPLSFLAGPAWDLLRLREKLSSREAEPARAPEPTAHAHPA